MTNNPNVQRLTEIMAPWVHEAVTTHALGDPVTWDINAAMLPTQQGMSYQLLLFLEIPAAMIGGTLINITIMPATSKLTQEQLERTVRESLEGLRAQRSESLAQTNGRAANGPGLLAP